MSNLNSHIQITTKYINDHAKHYKKIFDMYVNTLSNNNNKKTQQLFSDFIKSMRVIK